MASDKRDSTNTTKIALIGCMGAIVAAIIGACATIFAATISMPTSSDSTSTYAAISDGSTTQTQIPFPGEVVSTNLFESNSRISGTDNRTYSKVFHHNTARYVFWELRLKFAPTGKRFNSSIHTIWRRSDGTVLQEDDYSFAVEPNWESLIAIRGLGNDTPGFWGSGSYSIHIYIDGTEIASKNFVVED